MNKKKSRSLRKFFPYIFLVGLAIALYANTLSLDYALDDTLILTGNEFTSQGIAGIPDILTNDAFTGFFGKQKNLVAGGRYRPLSQIMFAIEYQIFGFDPFIGHLMNVLLYAILAISLYLLFQRLFRSADIGKWWFSLAFLTTALFIAHPLHTEAVANIKGRDEILSMLFAVLAWHFSLRYWDTRRAFNLILSSIMLFLGLMSKENSITFLAVIPLSIYFFREARGFQQFVVIILPLFLSTLLFLILRFNALGFFMGGSVAPELLNNPYVNASSAEKFATNLLTWGRYLYLMLIPHPLTHDYYPAFFELMGFDSPMVILVMGLLAGLIILAFRLFRKKHMVSFAILYFFITFSIVSNVIFNIGTFMNERFLFIPLLGFSLLTAWALLRLKGIRQAGRLSFIVAGIILAGYSVRTVARNPAWADDYTLFTTDVKVSSNSIKCNVSAGGKSLERYERTEDEAERARLLAQAIPWLEKGVRLHPSYLAGWEQLGKAYYFSKDVDRAWICYLNCFNIKPSESSRTNLGLVADLALKQKEYNKAIRYLGKMREIDPEEAIHATRLADAYIATNRSDSALQAVDEALSTMPDDYLLLGKAGEIWGRYMNRLDLSEQYLERSVAANPGYVTSVENLGIVYGMTGRMQRSLELLRQALELEPDNPRIMTNIANTLKSMGQLEEAQQYFSRATAAEKK